MTFHSRMTSKGQITVPKAVREDLGVGPGEEVEFVKNERGETVLRPVGEERRLKLKQEELLKRMRAAHLRFVEQDPMPDISSDDYYELMRGPPAEV